MQTVLEVPRTEYSRDVAQFVTGSVASNNLKSYRSGIIFIMSLLASIWFIWILILLYFKCNSKYVGCAAGNAFKPPRQLSVRTIDDEDDAARRGTGSETSSFHGSSESSEQEKMAEAVENRVNKKESMKEGHSFSIGEQKQREVQPRKDHNSDSSIIETTKRSPRALRTRLCFLLFSLVTLACVPCVIIFKLKL